MSQMAMSSEQRQQIRALVKLEGTSWISIAVISFSYVLWGVALYLYSAGVIPAAALVFLSFVSFIAGYTPFHEAVHGAVSNWRFLNDWVGRLGSSMLLSPFQGFRYVHLKHHRHTNAAGVDPDLWSAKGLLLFHWLTQDFYYYYIYLLERRNNSPRVRIEVVLQTASLVGFAYWGCTHGYARIMIFGWLLPARFAIAWLSFTFTWMPHFPHDEKIQDNQYKSTCVRSSPWLTIPLLYQNYHLIHHLYPSAPFYRYIDIWKLGKEFFLSQGTREVTKILQV